MFIFNKGFRKIFTAPFAGRLREGKRTAASMSLIHSARIDG